MSETDKSGAAFPSSNSPDTGYYAEGMTLRDYFAAKALSGICANSRWNVTKQTENAARESYALADAMLKARQS